MATPVGTEPIRQDQPSPEPAPQAAPVAQPVVLVQPPPGQPAPVAPGQPVVYMQPAPAVQPVVVPAPAQEHRPPEQRAREEPELHVKIYSHSTFFYWWPVWVIGYIMALITYVGGQYTQIKGATDVMVLIHPSKNLGVIFTLLFFLVIVSTNVSLRGLSSVVLILGVAFVALLLAYFGLWESLLDALGRVYVYMNMGFYVFFASLVFVVWAFATFVYDRMTYWLVRPGQITQERLIGAAAKSYDTRGMVFEKHQEDLFRHWILGLGSGDIQISTTGARRETIYVPNVLFVDSKIDAIQRLIAMQPDSFATPQS
jgi:hypothetical protein